MASSSATTSSATSSSAASRKVKSNSFASSAAPKSPTADPSIRPTRRSTARAHPDRGAPRRPRPLRLARPRLPTALHAQDPIFAHQLGIVDPDDSFTKRKLYLPPHLVKPLRIMRLIVINGSPKRVKLTIGDTCGYYQPLIQQDLIQGHEARVLALQVREEVRRMHRLKAEAADVPNAASPASPAPLDETGSPPPGTIKTDVRGQARPRHRGCRLRRPHGAAAQHAAGPT